jgi:soluble lytic murein transglycosylase-like protein
LAFPESPAVFSSDMGEQRIDRPEQPKREVGGGASIRVMSPQARSIDAFLERHGVRKANRSRLADSVVTSARKYNLNPRLIASIMIIESRGNPFAISGKNAVGVMQIHVPTWGHTADREGINLLKIEDNVDFGARILNDYIRRFGLWEGVKRYNGFFADDPVSEQSAQEYVAKVQRVYEFHQPAASQPGIL